MPLRLLPRCTVCGSHQTLYTDSTSSLFICHCKCGVDDVIFNGIKQPIEDIDEDCFQFKVNCFDKRMAVLSFWDCCDKTPGTQTGEIRVVLLHRSLMPPRYVEASDDNEIDAVDLFNSIVRLSVPRCMSLPGGLYAHPPLYLSEGVFYIKSQEVVKMPFDEKKFQDMVFSSVCKDGEFYVFGKYVFYVFIGGGSPFGRWFCKASGKVKKTADGDSLFRKKVENGSYILGQTVKDIVREDMEGSFSGALDLEWDDV